MRVLYLDLFSGFSGDMAVGTLLDLGASLDAIKKGVSSLGISGFELAIRSIKRSGIAATKFDVRLPKPEHHHRTFSSIREMITKSSLPAPVRQKAIQVFQVLAEAEGAVHGMPVEKVHFHEVGAVDSIVDIVGACLALEELGIEAIYASAPVTGTGMVNTQHGPMPVPTPATVKLMESWPLREDSGAKGELLTPTGAAILRGLGAHVGERPALRIERSGYGAGERELSDRPNLALGIIGMLTDEGPEQFAPREKITVLETTIDHLSGEVVGAAMAKLMAEGALDASAYPGTGKKGRSALKIEVMVRPEDAARLARVLVEETGTLGVREHTLWRWVLDRRIETVDTPAGSVRMKLALLEGKVVRAAPEYDDCAALARKKPGVTVRQIQEMAMAAWNEKKQTSGK